MKEKNKIFSFLDVVGIVIITSIIMYFLGGMLLYKHLGGVNYSALGSDEKLKEFISTYNRLVNNYYDSLDREKLIEGAIEGMYSKVSDPYTTYMDSNNTQALEDSLSGEYNGIGIQIQQMDDGKIEIVNVFDDSPAQKVGIEPKDIITHIAGEDISGKRAEEISEMIKKYVNSEIKVTVTRDSKPLTFLVKVDKLFIPVVNIKLLERNNKRIGYIGLTLFNDTADVQFEKSLSTLENSGIDSLIIDLRNNTGGYLEVAKNIAEMFIEKNKIIYSLESKDSKTAYRDATNDKRTYKIVVLINNGSASASEILAAALKYSYNATLIGTKTYGKGKVQEKSSLSNGNTVKYTTAKWLTPNGDCIDGIGLNPDIEITFDRSNYYVSDIYSDSQILGALKYLVD